MPLYRPHQQGMTFPGLVVRLGVIGFFCLLMLKIGPLYYEHFKVKSSLKGLASEPDLQSKSREEILSMLTRRFDINSIEHVTDRDIQVAQDSAGTQVKIAYQASAKVLGNLSVLVTFDDAVEVRAP